MLTNQISETPICQWFAFCENIATTTELHPILGDVPICGRCKERNERIDAKIAERRT